MSNERSSTRRRFLTTSAAFGAVAVAGCSGDDGESGTDGAETGTPEPTDEETPEETETEMQDPPVSLSYGESAELRLESGDGSDPAYEGLAKPVTFEAEDGDEVLVQLSSKSIDTRLILQRPNGTVVGTNDDIEDDENTDSQLLTTLDQDGEYTVWCSSNDGSQTGPFTLSVDTVASVDIGSTEEFTLEANDGTDPLGDLSKPVRFQGVAGEALTITMTADAFDTYLVLVGPEGNVVAENDDAGYDSGNSELTTELPRDGRYTIWCGSYDGDATGAFSLSLTTPELLSYGDSGQFTLSEGDSIDPNGDLSKPFTFLGDSGEEVVVEMSSDEFDTYLLLTDQDGFTVAENDDRNGSTTDSKISVTLDADGLYTIWAGSYEGNVTGPFTLSLALA